MCGVKQQAADRFVYLRDVVDEKLHDATFALGPLLQLVKMLREQVAH